MSDPKQSEKVYQGIPAAPGVAHGPAFLFIKREVEVPQRPVPPERREEEIARFEMGLLETRRQISAIRAEIEEKLGEEEASIFDAHQLVLEDRALIEETIREVVEGGYNIEYSFQQVAERYIEAFSRIDDDYIKERVADIRDVSRRLLYNLLGRREGGDFDKLSKGEVLVADDLTPSDTAKLSLGSIVGVVTEVGSRTSHSVIMARSLNVPCVVGLHGLTRDLSFGDVVLVDGFEGRVIVNPQPESMARYGRLRSERAEMEKRFAQVLHNKPLLRDEHPFVIRLNVEGNESKELLLNSGAEGVGLFRTEGIFLASRSFPSEEAQFQVYDRIARQLSPAPCTIRTLDLGGDKNPHDSLSGFREANPFLGFRAIRFCLENPGLFKEQLRAILRASAVGNVRMMYPMISCIEEVTAANALLDECKAELRAEGKPFAENMPVGVMIEIPSAAVIADHLAEHCSFFSIGTNDLIQYMLAVDRVNDRIAHLYQPSHPAVLRALKFIVDGARQSGLPVSVCGELAGDPRYAGLLLGLGVDELSVAWSAVPEVKYLLLQMRMNEAKKLAVDVLRLKCPHEINERLDAFYEKYVGVPPTSRT